MSIPVMDDLVFQEQSEGVQDQPPAGAAPEMNPILLLFNMQQQMLEMQKQLMLLQAQTSTTAPVTVLPPSQPKMKHSPPEPYNGDKGNSSYFLSQLHNYFESMQATDDREKVNFALSLCRHGTALSWAKGMYKQLEVAVKPDWANNWDLFESQFRQFFRDTNLQQNAIFKLGQLKQGKRPVDLYITEFDILADDTGFNDAALVEKFKSGLHASLVDKITLTLYDVPTTLKGWKEAATKFDTNYQMRMAEKQLEAKPTKPTTTTSAAPSHSTRQFKPLPPIPSSFPPSTVPFVAPSQPRPNFPVPMEVDSARKGYSARPAPVCYRCRQRGHIAAKCTANYDLAKMDVNQLQTWLTQPLPNIPSQSVSVPASVSVSVSDSGSSSVSTTSTSTSAQPF